MRTTYALVMMALVLTTCIYAQAPAAQTADLSKDPHELLALAAPLYDFNSPDLKPWHMKVSYQLFDEKEKPTEQGTFEYWWVSSQQHRSSWTRAGVTRTDWDIAGGRHAYLATGEHLNYFEYELARMLLSPLPDSSASDPAQYRLENETIKFGDVKLMCAMVIPKMPQQGKAQTVPLGLFPTYCFDRHLPVLRSSFSFGSIATQFNKIARFQNRYIPGEIAFFEGKRKLLTATLDEIGGLAPTDSALLPVQGAHDIRPGKVTMAPAIAGQQLIRKQVPVYPQDAKDARVSGKVVLAATIGIDGGVHDLRVIEAPWPSLVASALWAVSHWQYKPYLLNGEPVEVQTDINVIFEMSR